MASTATITKLSVALDSDKDLVLQFETAVQKYLLIVILSDTNNLGWRESRAIIDSLETVRVGQTMDEATFKALATKLSSKYDKVRGPFEQQGIYALVVQASRGRINTSSDNTLVMTSLEVSAKDNLLLLRSYTKMETSFAVAMVTAKDGLELSDSECRLFLGTLSLLEVGNKITEDYIVSTMQKIKSKGYFVDVSKKSFDGKECLVCIISTSGGKKEKQSSSSSVSDTSTILSSISDSGDLQCPYAGITYVKALKESGQAQVYDARKEGKRVAVKVFNEGDDQIDTYKTELRMLLQMTRHKNVVKIIDFFETPKPAIVMEFIEGQDLHDYLEEKGGQSQAEGLKLCIGIAEGLTHMHRHGIIHRDLKSMNILRRSDGTPVIIDLGLGSVLRKPRGTAGADGKSAEMTIAKLCEPMSDSHVAAQTIGMKGTLLWMAPEMITSHTWSDRTDVYALAIIAWEIFSGKQPFLSEMNVSNLGPLAIMLSIISGERPSLSAMSHVDTWVRKLIVQCWDGEPAKRPKMIQVLQTLQRSDPDLLFKSADLDGSGALSFGEFVMFLERHMPGSIDGSNMFSTFKTFTDKESKMTINGFYQFCKSSK